MKKVTLIFALVLSFSASFGQDVNAAKKYLNTVFPNVDPMVIAKQTVYTTSDLLGGDSVAVFNNIAYVDITTQRYIKVPLQQTASSNGVDTSSINARFTSLEMLVKQNSAETKQNSADIKAVATALVESKREQHSTDSAIISVLSILGHQIQNGGVPQQGGGGQQSGNNQFQNTNYSQPQMIPVYRLVNGQKSFEGQCEYGGANYQRCFNSGRFISYGNECYDIDAQNGGGDDPRVIFAQQQSGDVQHLSYRQGRRDGMQKYEVDQENRTNHVAQATTSFPPAMNAPLTRMPNMGGSIVVYYKNPQ